METLSIGIERGMIATSTTMPMATGTSASHTCHSDIAMTPGTRRRRRRRAARRRSAAPEEGVSGT